VTGFVPTGTISTIVNERQRSLRPPIIYRLKNIMINCGAFLHLVIVLLCSIGVASRVRYCMQDGRSDLRAIWINLLLMVGWPPCPWFQQVSACLTPLQYALFPPDVPARETFLDRDPLSGIAYPSSKAKEDSPSTWELRYSQLYSLIVPYTLFVLISTWWI
jgi:hypothetical protein